MLPLIRLKLYFGDFNFERIAYMHILATKVTPRHIIAINSESSPMSPGTTAKQQASCVDTKQNSHVARKFQTFQVEERKPRKISKTEDLFSFENLVRTLAHIYIEG